LLPNELDDEGYAKSVPTPDDASHWKHGGIAALSVRRADAVGMIDRTRQILPAVFTGR
jgi:hypothetical protein